MKRLPYKLEAKMFEILAKNNNDRKNNEPKPLTFPNKVTLVEGQLVFPLPKKEEE